MPNRIPFQKTYTNSHDLVVLLQSRGLTVNDPLKAERYLDFIGYYRLSAYMYPLLRMPKAAKIGVFRREAPKAPTPFLDIVVLQYVTRIEKSSCQSQEINTNPFRGRNILKGMNTFTPILSDRNQYTIQCADS